ncbi:MAG TPA: helix-turn-helix domain-containing protein [Pedococcus sp.]|nr:helix-turn-helix domain-containing protein [Pedococcus sp.]
MTTTSMGDLGASRHLVVSERIRERRRALGLTQKQVVTRLGRLGIRSTNKALSSLEHGAGVDVVRLPELAVALDCSVTWLLGLTDDPGSWEPHPGATRHTPSAPRTPSGSSGPPAPRPWILGPLTDEG